MSKSVINLLSVNRMSIERVRVWLTDQNSKLIDLRGEKVTVNLHIREVKNINVEK